MTEYLKNIGKRGFYLLNSLMIPITIISVRSAFGRIDYQITVVGGEGCAWVSEEKIIINN